MKAAKRKHAVDPPELPEADAMETLDVERLVAQAYELARIEGATLNDASASGLRFESCVLVRIELERASLPNLGMVDVRLERSSATNGMWAKPNLRRVEIVGARLTGLTIDDGELSDVLFRECKADFLRVTASRLRDVRFEDCVLAELDLRDSLLERVAFAGCDLRGADMSKAKLGAVDLGGSNVAGLGLTAAQLGSLTIDPSQALPLVQILGAKVR